MSITYLAGMIKKDFFGGGIRIDDGIYIWQYTSISHTKISFFSFIESINNYFISTPPVGWTSGDNRPFINLDDFENPTIVYEDDRETPFVVNDVTVGGNFYALYGLGCNNKEQDSISPVAFHDTFISTFPYWGAFRLPNEVIRVIKDIWLKNGYTKRTPIKKNRKGITWISYYRIYNTPFKSVNGFKFSYRIEEKDMQAFDLFINTCQNGELLFKNDNCCGDGYIYYLATHESLEFKTDYDFLNLSTITLDLYKKNNFKGA